MPTDVNITIKIHAPVSVLHHVHIQINITRADRDESILLFLLINI